MRLLLELLEPISPGSIKKKRIQKNGVQGSKISIIQHEFTTAKGNNVKVQFKPSMEDNIKSVDIVFYVNDTMDDESSSIDPVILPNVFYVIFSYLDSAKIDHCTFHAIKGKNDDKVKYNLPREKTEKELGILLDRFIERLSKITISAEMVRMELDRVNQLYRKVGKPEVSEVVVIYKEELLGILSRLREDIIGGRLSVEILDSILGLLVKYNKNVSGWEEYRALEDGIRRMRLILYSYGSEGVFVHSNRRFNIYKKVLEKYYSDRWEILTVGANFELIRK